MAESNEEVILNETEMIDSTKKTALSFGFSKKIEHKVKGQSIITDTNIHDVRNDPDFITSVDQSGISGSKGGNQKYNKLVIPLIKNNNWREETSDLERQAIDELLAESKADIDSDCAISRKLNIAIPLLMRNQPPVGYETEEKLDVSLHPNEAEDADYEQIPIEDYGLAMLRGMGWKDGEGIGKDKKIVPTIDAVLRPKGMGLGADKSQVLQDKFKKKNNNIDDKDKLEMKKNAYCCIVSGPHKGLYCQIQGIDEDNARVVVKMALSGQAVTLSQFAINLMTEKEYLRNCNVLNKAKVDEYKEKESKSSSKNSRDDNDANSDHTLRHSKHKHKKRRSHSSSPHRSKKHKSHKHKNHDNSSHESNDTNSSKYADKSDKISDVRPWLDAQLKVRIVDKNYKNGKYYNTKVVIVDVLTPKLCSCKTDDGRLLENLNQDMLETVIPRSNPAYVRLIVGKHRGQTGEIIEKNKTTSTAAVQLLRDRDRVINVAFDHICEYVGDISEDFDF